MYSQSCVTLAKKEHAIQAALQERLKEESALLTEQVSMMSRDNGIMVKTARDIVQFNTKIRLAEQELRNMKKEMKLKYRARRLAEHALERVKAKLSKAQDKVNGKTRELDVTRLLINEMRGRAVDASAGISLNDLKTHLPTEVLNHIGSFLPYNIQYHLLEARYNPIRRLSRLSMTALKGLYIKITNIPEVLDMQTASGRRIYIKANTLLRQGFYYFPDGVTGMRVRIIKLIYDMKMKCPKKALQLLKEMCIFIDPKKKYITRIDVLRTM